MITYQLVIIIPGLGIYNHNNSKELYCILSHSVTVRHGKSPIYPYLEESRSIIRLETKSLKWY